MQPAVSIPKTASELCANTLANVFIVIYPPGWQHRVRLPVFKVKRVGTSPDPSFRGGRNPEIATAWPPAFDGMTTCSELPRAQCFRPWHKNVRARHLPDDCRSVVDVAVVIFCKLCTSIINIINHCFTVRCSSVRDYGMPALSDMYRLR